MERHYSRSKPDLRSKAVMLDWLDNHFKYYMMNSWNAHRGYANCIKLHSLGLPRELEAKFWNFLSLDSLEHSIFWDDIYPDLKSNLKEDTGYDCFVNGRSGGYLVFNMELPDLYNETPVKKVRDVCRDVMRFDVFCDELREEFIWYLQTYDFVEEEYIVTKKHIVEKEVE